MAAYASILLLNASLLLIPVLYRIAEPVNTYHNKALITVLCIVIAAPSLYRRLRSGEGLTDIGVLIVGLLLVSLLVLVVQAAIPSGSDRLIDLVGNGYSNCVLLLYFPLVDYLRDDCRFRTLVNAVVTVGVLFAVALTVWMLVVESGLTIPGPMMPTQVVNGQLRLPQGADVVGVTVVMLLVRTSLARSTSVVGDRALLVLLVAVLLFVARVKMMTVACVGALLVTAATVWVSREEEVPHRPLLVAALVCFGLGLLGAYAVMDGETLVSTVLGTGQRQASALVRLDAVAYYSRHILDHWIFGFGFTNDFTIMRYTTTDIGVLGVVFRYGLLGVLLVVGSGLVCAKRIRRRTDTLPAGISLIAFLVLTSGTLSFIDSQRVVLFAFLLAVFEYLTRENHEM